MGTRLNPVSYTHLDRFIRHPSEAVKVGDIVTVWVLGVDLPKKRISLTMKKPAEKKE